LVMATAITNKYKQRIVYPISFLYIVIRYVK